MKGSLGALLEAPPRRRRPLRSLLLVIVAALAATVGVAFWYLRHVPWEIPAELRPPIEAAEGLRLRYLGISGYELTDGRTTILLDPTLTRPTLRELLTGPLEEPELTGDLVPQRADYILVNHAHYDHAMDVPWLAKKTGATVIGSQSTVNLALARGVPSDKVRRVEPGETLRLGSFEVRVGSSRHTDIAFIPNPMAGIIPADAGRLWFWQYTSDGCLSFRLESEGRSVWFHPTSTYERGELEKLSADTLILGVTGEPMTEEKLAAILDESKPSRVLPTHYDNFFHPREKGMALMPKIDLAALKRQIAAIDPAVEVWVLGFGESVVLPDPPSSVATGAEP